MLTINNEQKFNSDTILIKRVSNDIYITIKNLVESNIIEYLNNYIDKSITLSIDNNYWFSIIFKRISYDKTTKNYIIIGEEN